MSKRRLKLAQSSAIRSKLREVGVRRIALTLEDTNPFAKRPNLAADMVELRRRKAAQLMAGYYSGTLRALQGVLADPRTKVIIRPNSFRFHRDVNVPVGNHGSRMRQTESIRLESGVTTNSKWEGLGPNYAEGEGRWEGLPPSVTLWRKTGQLSRAYRVWFASQQARLSNPESYYVGRPKEVANSSARLKTKYQPTKGYGYSSSVGAYLSKSTKSVLAQWQFTLVHPGLSNPVLNLIVRRPYLYGEARGFDMDRYGGVLNRTATTTKVFYSKGARAGMTIPRTVWGVRTEGLNRMALAEARRPMISRFARAAGQRELEALRKLLKR